MKKSTFDLPIIADLPLDQRSDAEILAAIEREIASLKNSKQIFDEAAAALPDPSLWKKVVRK